MEIAVCGWKKNVRSQTNIEQQPEWWTFSPNKLWIFVEGDFEKPQRNNRWVNSSSIARLP
jgi:hypothetical protein